jgi:hypothetical protein
LVLLLQEPWSATSVSWLSHSFFRLKQNKKLKNNLVTAQKHFTTAAINAAANQPIKAANHARRGIGALKNYIGANQTNM